MTSTEGRCVAITIWIPAALANCASRQIASSTSFAATIIRSASSSILCIEKQKGSTSMIQRQFRVGFNRAARIMEQLYDAGVVGPGVGLIAVTRINFPSSLSLMLS